VLVSEAVVKLIVGLVYRVVVIYQISCATCLCTDNSLLSSSSNNALDMSQDHMLVRKTAIVIVIIIVLASIYLQLLLSIHEIFFVCGK
jgi:predicted membrane protein